MFLNLQNLYDLVSNHPAVLEIGIENYVNSGISIGIDDAIDPSLVEQGLVTLQNNNHFAITQKGLNAVSLPAPDWEGFNFALFSDADFISYGIAAQSVNPYLVPALTERYGKIAELGLAGSGFSAYWDSFCSSLSVTTTHREGWAVLAEANDLPADLVSVIRA